MGGDSPCDGEANGAFTGAEDGPSPSSGNNHENISSSQANGDRGMAGVGMVSEIPNSELL